MGDEQAHGGDVWIDEVEMVMIAELYEGMCLLGVELLSEVEGGASILE